MATLKEMLNVEHAVSQKLKAERDSLNSVVKSRKQAMKSGKRAENRAQAAKQGKMV